MLALQSLSLGDIKEGVTKRGHDLLIYPIVRSSRIVKIHLCVIQQSYINVQRKPQSCFFMTESGRPIY